MASRRTAKPNARVRHARRFVDVLSEIIALLRKAEAAVAEAQEPTDLQKGRPAYLPDFQNLIQDLRDWRDIVEDHAAELQSEPETEE